MNLARLNHILIPEDAAKREAWRTGRIARYLRPVGWFYTALSEEGRVASVMCLFLGSMAVDVARTQVFVVWAALVGLLIGALLFRSRYSMSSASFDVALPQHVTAGQPFDATLTLRNETGRDVYHVRTRRPFLSWDGRYQSEASRLPQCAPGQCLTFTERLTFTQRGPHDLGRFSCVELVPPGLSVGASTSTERSQLLVYPRPANVTSLSVPGSGLRQEDDSAYVRSQDGEPYEVRPYRVGDRVRDLHAKTWARTAVPHVRQYMQPSSARAMLIIDVDGDRANETTVECIVSLAAGVAAAAATQGIEITRVMCGNDLSTADSGAGVLDVLAVCDPGARTTPATAVSHSAGLSAVWVFTNTSDESSQVLARTLEDAGVGCAVLCVQQEASFSTSAISTTDILEQRPLTL